MTEYYLNNGYKGSENYTGCSVQVGTLTTLRAAIGTFNNVTAAVDEPFWVVTSGTGGDAKIGVYKVQTVAGDGSSVVLDRNITTGAETVITAMGVAYDGLAEVPGGGHGPLPTFAFAFDQLGDDDTLWVKTNGGYIWHQDVDFGEDIDDIDQYKERVTVSCEPDYDNGYHIWVRAYKTNTGDMDFGGAFYGGALDAYKSENSLTSKMRNSLAEWCDLDGDGQGTELFYFFQKNQIHFHNFRFRNTEPDPNNPVFAKLVNYNGAVNCVMSNCKFKGPAWFAVGNVGHRNKFQDCWFGDMLYAATEWVRYLEETLFLSCVFECVPNGIAWGTSVQVINSVFVGGEIGIELIWGYRCLVANCLFYNQSVACIKTSAGGEGDEKVPELTEFNNIFFPATDDCYAVYMVEDGVLQLSRNSVAGTVSGVSFSVPPWFHATGNRDIRDVSCTVNADIRLKDPASANFEMAANAVLEGEFFVGEQGSVVGSFPVRRSHSPGPADLVTAGVGGF